MARKLYWDCGLPTGILPLEMSIANSAGMLNEGDPSIYIQPSITNPPDMIAEAIDVLGTTQSMQLKNNGFSGCEIFDNSNDSHLMGATEGGLSFWYKFPAFVNNTFAIQAGPKVENSAEPNPDTLREVTNITAGNPCQITFIGGEFLTATDVTIRDTGVVALDDQVVPCTVISANVVEVALDGTGWTSGGTVAAPRRITNITATNPAQITFVGDAIPDTYRILITGTGVAALDNKRLDVTVISPGVIEVGADGTGWVSGGDMVIPWDTNEGISITNVSDLGNVARFGYAPEDDNGSIIPESVALSSAALDDYVPDRWGYFELVWSVSKSIPGGKSLQMKYNGREIASTTATIRRFAAAGYHAIQYGNDKITANPAIYGPLKGFDDITLNGEITEGVGALTPVTIADAASESQQTFQQAITAISVGALMFPRLGCEVSNDNGATWSFEPLPHLVNGESFVRRVETAGRYANQNKVFTVGVNDQTTTFTINRVTERAGVIHVGFDDDTSVAELSLFDDTEGFFNPAVTTLAGDYVLKGFAQQCVDRGSGAGNMTLALYNTDAGVGSGQPTLIGSSNLAFTGADEWIIEDSLNIAVSSGTDVSYYFSSPGGNRINAMRDTGATPDMQRTTNTDQTAPTPLSLTGSPLTGQVIGYAILEPAAAPDVTIDPLVSITTMGEVTITSAANVGWVSEIISNSSGVPLTTESCDWYVRDTLTGASKISGTSNLVGGVLTIDNDGIGNVGETVQITIIVGIESLVVEDQTIVDLDA